MSTINIIDYIIPLDKIIDKNIDGVTFKEVISLVFHATQIIINDETDPDHNIWNTIYTEFNKDLEDQNIKKWPHMTITKNDYGKRIDIFSTDTSFIPTNNIYMLLLRLLYIEKYKRPYVYRSYKYHKILGYKSEYKIDYPVKNISLTELFEILAQYMKYYLKIYNDAKYIEFNLGKEIIDQLN